MNNPEAITWFGHASVLLELGGARLLCDPVLGNRVGPLVRIAPSVRVSSLGRLDAVLLSHLHADHTDLGSLRAIGGDVPVLAPYPAGNWLRRHGLHNVRELRAGEQTAVDAVGITATQATHPRARRPFGPAADPIGYLMSGSAAAYFAGDTDLFAGMADLRSVVDVALLPVSGWGASLGPGHLDPERAARAVEMIRPRIAIPIHWGTLALGWPARKAVAPEAPAHEFAALTRRLAPAVDVRVLAPGERTELGRV
jgi:L-ascorbate metabolism protein UlaG (beta-lactamase superfamily)